MGKLQELRQMLDHLKEIRGKKQGGRAGLTRLELTVIVGALTVFASIYTYVVLGAIASKPLVIG